ncbi:MAG: acetyl esterase [Mycobacterium sp.]|jgi:acetyl esterase|nr:acetyl esterase [Mycobacterium sp.]
MSLDPQIAGQIRSLNNAFPRVEAMTAAQARATIRARFVPATQPETLASVHDQTVKGPGGEIAVRIYRPAAERRLPALIYAHGGGFVFCDLDSHDELCRHIANHASALVISVAYRLAPEHPWPAGAEDMFAVTTWTADNANALGADPSRLCVGGDSAGGNLAAATALMARDRSGPALAVQLLIYPTLAADFGTESYRLFGTGYYNPATAMRWYWDQYVPFAGDRENPYAVPLYADPRGLPPAIVVTAGHDPLRDDGLAFGRNLSHAGVPIVRRHYEGAIHGFMTMPGLNLARRARREVCADLARRLLTPTR